MINYRQATNSDFELTFQIKSDSIKPYIEKIWGWNYELQLDFHKKDFKPAQIQIILDESGQEIGLLNKVETDQSIHLLNLLIRDTAQGKGIGTNILKDMILQSRLTNRKIELQVFKINDGARRLYQKLGFSIIAETEFHYQMTFHNNLN